MELCVHPGAARTLMRRGVSSTAAEIAMVNSCIETHAYDLRLSVPEEQRYKTFNHAGELALLSA